MPKDAPAIQKHVSNWNIVRYLGADAPWPYPEDGALAHMNALRPAIEAGQVYLWGLVLKSGPDEVIGLLEFRFKENKDDNRGFWLAEPFWGRGYMSEAVAAAQDFIFFELGKDRVVAKNVVGNEASRRVKEKTGARLIGRDKGLYHEGEMEQDVWEITKESWTAFRRS